MRVLFVKHDHASPAGLVGDAFTGLGYDVCEFTVVPAERYHRPDVAAVFPDPAHYDAIVAFGAVWSVYDDAAIGTWVHDEIAFTREAIGLGVPVLGICFGGQMLAAAVGGEVTRAPSPEIGWHRVYGDSDLVGPGLWFQWHYDRFTPPPGIPVIASSALASQAFVYGRSLGVQFHPEVTASVLECWLDSDGGAAELAVHGIDAAELLTQTRRLADGFRTRSLVQGFVTNIAAAPVTAAR